MHEPSISLRTDAASYTVARQMVERLGCRIHRTVARQNLPERPMRSDPSRRLLVNVRYLVLLRPPFEMIAEGYDTRLTVNPESKDPQERGAEVWRLFDEVCEHLGYPALLESGTALLAAWSPRLGLRRFPPGTRGLPEDKERWADYALPAVESDEEPVAPDDELGQLYARIVADPDDEGLRLAYADVVEAEHPEYAELIRLGVQRVRDRRAGVGWDQARWIRLNQLERRYHDEIVPVRVRGFLGENWHIRRGFVEATAQPAESFLRWAPRLVAGIPLRMLYLTGGAQEHLDELAALPELARLRGLSFWGNPIGDEGLRRFLNSPHLTGLRLLSVANTGVTSAGIEALAASDALPNLKYVVADPKLRLNPVPGYDYDGTLVHIDEGYLGMRLAEQYDREWLRWQPKVTDDQVWEPEYAEL